MSKPKPEYELSWISNPADWNAAKRKQWIGGFAKAAQKALKAGRFLPTAVAEVARKGKF